MQAAGRGRTPAADRPRERGRHLGRGLVRLALGLPLLAAPVRAAATPAPATVRPHPAPARSTRLELRVQDDGAGAGGAPLAPVPDARRGQGVVALDARDGSDAEGAFATSARYAGLRARLEARGLRIVGRSTFTGARLAGVDVLFLQARPGGRALTRRERASVLAFVQRGGTLLLHGGSDEPLPIDVDFLARAYGVRFQEEPRPAAPEGRDVWGLRPDPLTRGVQGLHLDAPRPFASVVSPARDLTYGVGAEDVLAVAEPPAGGRVLVLGDASAWRDAAGGARTAVHGLDAVGNRRLLANVLDQAFGADATAGSSPRPDSAAPRLSYGRLDLVRQSWAGPLGTAGSPLELALPPAAPAGRPAVLSIRGARPGALLVAVLGHPGPDGGLEVAHFLGTTLADAEGQAWLEVLVPYDARTQAFGLRVLDPIEGTVSDVVAFTPR